MCRLFTSSLQKGSVVLTHSTHFKVKFGVCNNLSLSASSFTPHSNLSHSSACSMFLYPQYDILWRSSRIYNSIVSVVWLYDMNLYHTTVMLLLPVQYFLKASVKGPIFSRSELSISNVSNSFWASRPATCRKTKHCTFPDFDVTPVAPAYISYALCHTFQFNAKLPSSSNGAGGLSSDSAIAGHESYIWHHVMYVEMLTTREVVYYWLYYGMWITCWSHASTITWPLPWFLDPRTLHSIHNIHTLQCWLITAMKLHNKTMLTNILQ